MTMDDARPPIPTELRRRILVEAGHRCAIPTCRYIEVDVHHIIPWATCRTHEYDNLIALCPNCHRRADRGEIDRKSLRLYKLNLRFAHDKYSQLELDVLFELKRTGEGMPWVGFNLILLKRIIDSGFIAVHENNSAVTAMGIETEAFVGQIKTSPDIIAITPKGRQFIEELGISEL
jgi:5-methylcytosine-specific restriction endonuclease McrA